jgi:hypothetical protein
MICRFLPNSGCELIAVVLTFVNMRISIRMVGRHGGFVCYLRNVADGENVIKNGMLIGGGIAREVCPPVSIFPTPPSTDPARQYTGSGL